MIIKQNYFEGFNFLRFFAAISIVLYHNLIPFSKTLSAPFYLLLHNLSIGVDLFFLISGFLIIYLLVEEKKQTNRLKIFSFFGRRILRIFPLYFLIILIAYLINVYILNDVNIDYKPFLYFWGNMNIIQIQNWPGAILTPLWSICVEEHFYLFIPIIVSIVPLKYLKFVLYLMVLLSFGYRFYTFSTIEYPWFRIYLHTLSRIDVIAIGGIIAIHYDHLKQKLKIGSWLILLLTAIVIINMILIDNMDYNTWAAILFKKYLLIIPFIGIILLILYTESSIVSFIRNNKYLEYLGKCSFGIYVFHNIVMTLLSKYMNLGTFAYCIVTLILTIIISIISYEFFEKQMLKLKRFI